MTEKTKILIGDDSAEYGLSWASLLKEEGMFAVTRQKNGRIIPPSRQKVVTVDILPYRMAKREPVPEVRPDTAYRMEKTREVRVRLKVVSLVASKYSPMKM